MFFLCGRFDQNGQNRSAIDGVKFDLGRVNLNNNDAGIVRFA